MNIARYFDVSPDVSAHDRYVHGTQLALGAVVTAEGFAGIVAERLSNGYGLTFTFGSLAMIHAYTQLRGGYSRHEVIVSSEEESVASEQIEAALPDEHAE